MDSGIISLQSKKKYNLMQESNEHRHCEDTLLQLSPPQRHCNLLLTSLYKLHQKHCNLPFPPINSDVF
uniref:Uncharacterized protein n=1 Tax=Megaselia scalaris TaxID=36166 RepID=T1GC79_MEGSC